MKGISINGKFLGAPLNGVHRTAALYTEALLSHRAAGTDIEIVAPRMLASDPLFDQMHPRVIQSRLGSGQGWEMITLPRATRQRLLVNLCNLAPLAHPNSVVMIHDAQTYLYPRDYTGRQATAYRMMLPLIARRARRIVTVSDFAKRSLVENGVAPENKISVVHNGTDHLLRITPDESVLRRHALVPRGFVLALGAAKFYKNIPRLFAAFDHPDLADLPLVVAGGPPAAAYDGREAAPPLQTRFLGHVSDGELHALYRHAAMFLFPSRTEGFGLPPLEAMSCGCPVIAANAGAMPEICGAGALLVDPETTESWRKAVLRLRTPAESARLVKAGVSRARYFTWDRAGRRLWTIVSELAAEVPKPQRRITS